MRNCENYLPEAMNSLLAQSFRDFELIAIDDGSTDGTGRLLAAYADRDPRIRVHAHARTRGLPVTLNEALARCAAPLTARADGDDVYEPTRFAKQISFLRRHPDVGVLSCGFHRIGPSGEHMDTRLPTTGDPFIRFQMLFMNSLLHPGVMFRTELVRRVNGYDPTYWTAQDSDLWARLLPHTRMENLPEPLVSHRLHSRSMMRTRGQAGRRVSLRVPARLLSAYLDEELTPEDVRPAVELYQGFGRLNAAEAARGEMRLAQVLTVAERREPPAVREWFRRRISLSLIRQARRVPAGAAVQLCTASLRWHISGQSLREAALLPLGALRR